jgi:hypothetical protein
MLKKIFEGPNGRIAFGDGPPFARWGLDFVVVDPVVVLAIKSAT